MLVSFYLLHDLFGKSSLSCSPSSAWMRSACYNTFFVRLWIKVLQLRQTLLALFCAGLGLHCILAILASEMPPLIPALPNQFSVCLIFTLPAGPALSLGIRTKQAWIDWRATRTATA